MEARNKNVLIGGLLAIVLVMAVGYAAFATQLQITGTAKIESKWDVRFDNTVKDGTYTPATGFGTASTLSNTVSYSADDLTATIAANTSLTQPGDTISWTLKAVNKGTLPAKTTGVVIALADGKTGNVDQTNKTVTSTNGAIVYTVSEITKKELATTNEYGEITITAEYRDVKTEGNSANSYGEETGVKVTVDWTQKTSA